jgi:hypothetical protein
MDTSQLDSLRPCPYCGEPFEIVEVNEGFVIHHDQDCAMDQNPMARMVWKKKEHLIMQINVRPLEDALAAQLAEMTADRDSEQRWANLYHQQAEELKAENERLRSNLRDIKKALKDDCLGTAEELIDVSLEGGPQ